MKPKTLEPSKSYVLFEKGKMIGEVSDWILTERSAEVKNILGKEVLMPKPKDQCSFTSPKPIPRKSDLIVIYDRKIEFVLKITNVRGGTFVTADILKKSKIR